MTPKQKQRFILVSLLVVGLGSGIGLVLMALNENINLYKKELSQRDKFWNSPAGGVVLGIVGTIALIHIIDYSLPQ